MAAPVLAGTAPAFPLPASAGRRITTIIVHCSATRSGQSIGGPGEAANVVIDRWHKERGFKRTDRARALFNQPLASIGYHFVIGLDGRILTGRGLDEIGAHVAGHNTGTIGICLVGGLEEVARYSISQWQALAQLVRGLEPLCAAGVKVLGHRDLSPDKNGNGKVERSEWLKTCPGFDVAAWRAGQMLPLRAQAL